MKTKAILLQIIIGVLIFSSSFCQNKDSISNYRTIHFKSYNHVPAYISIRLHDLKGLDSITLYFWQNVLSEKADINMYLPHLEKRVQDKLGIFDFKINSIIGCGYVSLSLEKGSSFSIPLFIMDKYLIEPRDSILIDISKNEMYSDTIPHVIAGEYRLKYALQFSGRGSAKYQCRYLADQSASFEMSSFQLFNVKGRWNTDNHWDAALNTSLSILANYKSKINNIAYEILKADFIGNYESGKCNLFNWQWHLAAKKKDTPYLKYLARIYEDHFLNTSSNTVEKEGETLSNYYPSYIIEKARNVELTLGNNDKGSIYYLLKHDYDGELRDKLLTIYLLEQFKFANDLHEPLKDAFHVVKTGYCLNQLKELIDSQVKGAPAYNFALQDTSGEVITLQDFKGKVVFVDFWFTGCHSCAGYYQYQISKVEKYFEKNANVIFISICIDRDRKMWINSIHSGQYTTSNVHNVINLYTGGEGIYNPVIKHYKITGYPTPLLIDKRGRIFSSSIKYLGTKDELIQQIKYALNNKPTHE